MSSHLVCVCCLKATQQYDHVMAVSLGHSASPISTGLLWLALVPHDVTKCKQKAHVYTDNAREEENQSVPASVGLWVYCGFSAFTVDLHTAHTQSGHLSSVQQSTSVTVTQSTSMSITVYHQNLSVSQCTNIYHSVLVRHQHLSVSQCTINICHRATSTSVGISRRQSRFWLWQPRVTGSSHSQTWILNMNPLRAVGHYLVQRRKVSQQSDSSDLKSSRQPPAAPDVRPSTNSGIAIKN